MSMRDENTWDGALLERVAEFVRAAPSARDVVGVAARRELKIKAVQRRVATIEFHERCSIVDGFLLHAAIDLVRDQPYNMRLGYIVALFVAPLIAPVAAVSVFGAALGTNLCYEIARGAPSP